MPKKNRVVGIVTVCLKEDGTYQVTAQHGIAVQSMTGVKWGRVRAVLDELRALRPAADEGCCAAVVQIRNELREVEEGLK